MKSIGLIFIGLLTYLGAFSQLNFTEIHTSIPTFTGGTYDWRDYDHDGDSDLVIYGSIGGTYYTKIYRNDGNFVFTDVNANLPACRNPQQGVKWGDLNNDQNLDLVLTGNAGSATSSFSRIYLNNGNNVFTDINAGLPANNSGESPTSSAVWADFNNDGYQDIVIKGYSSPCNYFSNIFKNNGNGTFTNITSLFGSDNGNIVVGDFNNDGKIDISYEGFNSCSGSNYFTNLYQNTGNFSFTDIGSSFTQMLGNPSWVDFNNDGYLDLFLSGRGGSGGNTNYVALYKNNGNGTFTSVSVPFTTGTTFSSWGDYDHDGYKDLVINTSSGINIYHNNGGISFTQVTHNITAKGIATWVDANSDGSLELFINEGDSSKLYTLCSNPTATITPQSSTTICQGNSVVLNASSGNSYSWSNSQTSQSVTISQSGNYIVTVTKSGGCSASASVNITVNAQPTVSPSASPSTICNGNNTVLSANASAGSGTISTYTWSAGISGNTGSGTVSPSSNTTYIITVTNSNNCSATASASVTVNAAPTVSPTATPSAFCAGSNTTLTANSTAGSGTISTYAWNSGIGGNASGGSVSPSGNTTYTVTVTNSNSCSASGSVSVTVYPLPTVTFSLPAFINNHASALTLNGSPSGGNYAGLNGIIGNTLNPSQAGLGNKTVTYTYTNGNNCTGSASASTILYDTTGIVCTSYDTTTTHLYDTVTTHIYDTLTTSVSTTDTLIINVNLTGINPPNNTNTVTVYPNPAHDHIEINVGNLSSMSGYSIKVTNALGQVVFTSPVNQQMFYISLNSWTGHGVYVLYILDQNQTVKNVKEIVLQ